MVRTPMQDIERELEDLEYRKLYGAAEAKSEFALTLARARHRLGMTQKELADRLGLSQPYIAKLEGGDANPTLGAIGSMLAVLGLRLAMQSEPLLPQPTIGPSISAAEKEAPLTYDPFVPDSNNGSISPAQDAG